MGEGEKGALPTLKYIRVVKEMKEDKRGVDHHCRQQ
jgi:hypothetical protein